MAPQNPDHTLMTVAPGSGRVVVADDLPALRRLVTFWIDEADEFDVVGHAADGNDAIAAVIKSKADVLITDFEMPNCDGLETIERLRAAGSDVTILVFSGISCPDRQAEILAAGADGFVGKDQTGPQLLQALREAWARRQRRLRPALRAA